MKVKITEEQFKLIMDALEDMSKEQLYDFYQTEQDELLSESFDRVLDMYQKNRSGNKN